MKKLILIFLVVSSSLAFSAPLKEFRGMWVITWEIYKKDGQFLKGEKLKDRITEILDNAKLAGLNAVIWQVRQGGASYYQSSIYL